jgi:hypothetical protein
MYNVMETSYLNTTASAISGTLLPVTQALLSPLVYGIGSISVPAGACLGIRADLNNDFMVRSVEVDAPYDSAHYCTLLTAKSSLLTQTTTDGQYNFRDDYATPDMTASGIPAPYQVKASSQYSSYYPWYAFDRRNISPYEWRSAVQVTYTEQWIKFDMGAGNEKLVNKFRYRGKWSGGTGHAKTLSLYGSNHEAAWNSEDSLYWTLLGSWEDLSDPAAQEWTSWFTFRSSERYRYFMWSASQSTGNSVAFGEMQLVEAGATSFILAEMSGWTEYQLTWDGTRYSCDFGQEIPVGFAKLFFASQGVPSVVSGVRLLIDDTHVTSSGLELAGNVATFGYGYGAEQTYTLQNPNVFGAVPRVVLKYTGVYDVDRNVLFSPDRSHEKSELAAHWYGIEHGFAMPESAPWWFGTFSSVYESQRRVLLTDTSTSGYWVSPVIDYGYDVGIAQFYGYGSFETFVRSHDIAPPQVLFLLVTTQNDNSSSLIAGKHKRIFVDETGYTIGSVICDYSGEDGHTGNKIWRNASEGFAGERTRYHGSISKALVANFLAPGIAACTDSDHVQEVSSYGAWYNLCSCTLNDSTDWSSGTTVSGLPWGADEVVLFTKTFPVEDSSGSFVSVISANRRTVRTSVSMGFQLGNSTTFLSTLITEPVLLAGSDGFDIVEDVANSGWWVYLGGDVSKIYKIDVGSFNTVKFFHATEVHNDDGSVEWVQDDIYRGYLYDVDFAYPATNLVSIPDPYFGGFWAMTASGVGLFREQFDYDILSLEQVAFVGSGSLNQAGFSGLSVGSCDTVGNLWMIDQQQNRLVHLDIQKAITGDQHPVDYDATLSGSLLGVYAHPSEGFGYVLIGGEPGPYESLDLIRRAHYTQSSGGRLAMVCTLPGFSSKDYPGGVDFSGITMTGYYQCNQNHSLWGTPGIPWEPYASGMVAGRGRYKQFKVMLQRDSFLMNSPMLERFRLPTPIILEPLDHQQITKFVLKVRSDVIRTTGFYEVEFLVYWMNREA